MVRKMKFGRQGFETKVTWVKKVVYEKKVQVKRKREKIWSFEVRSIES